MYLKVIKIECKPFIYQFIFLILQVLSLLYFICEIGIGSLNVATFLPLSIFFNFRYNILFGYIKQFCDGKGSLIPLKKPSRQV